MENFAEDFRWKWRLLSDLIGKKMQENLSVYKMEKKMGKGL